MRWLAALVLLPLAGCVGEPACEDLQSSVLTPWVGRPHLVTDAATPWDTLLFIPDAAGDDVVIEASASGGAAFVEPVSPEFPAFQWVRVQPETGAASVEAAWSHVREDAGCRAGSSGSLRWSLDPPTPGDSAQPGQGVHVHTAGFWENGTLFYTNIEALHANVAWPRATWYEWSGGEPLPVYVYEEEGSERPAYWAPMAGTPLDGAAWAYFTTIPGFNEALKGLSTHTTRVVHLAPEEAYTRPGNEEHPLYGDALVFFIHVVSVVDVPCPPAVECRVTAGLSTSGPAA